METRFVDRTVDRDTPFPFWPFVDGKSAPIARYVEGPRSWPPKTANVQRRFLRRIFRYLDTGGGILLLARHFLIRTWLCITDGCIIFFPLFEWKRSQLEAASNIFLYILCACTVICIWLRTVWARPSAVEHVDSWKTIAGIWAAQLHRRLLSPNLEANLCFKLLTKKKYNEM